jgi:prephenate dehydratase
MICGETKIRIIHCLLAPPGTKIADIKEVYSHPQALAQCSNFLNRLNVESIPSYDTAGSAKTIMEKQICNAAAIASERAAQTYGLNILRRNIEDFAENYTRFFVIGRLEPPKAEKNKTSIVFGAKHTPGSLYSVLGELARRSINLTKIESRPVRTTPWEYSFFVDFEGHYRDKSCAEALEAMKQLTTHLRVLGSYANVN